MKTNHTPGEYGKQWYTEECSNGGLIVVLGKRDERIQIINPKKAILIASAPELLKQLIEYVEFLERSPERIKNNTFYADFKRSIKKALEG